MNSDEIAELARAIGLEVTNKLKQFAAAVAEAQRERCAKLIWQHRSKWMQHNDWSKYEEACALLARVELDVRHA